MQSDAMRRSGAIDARTPVVVGVGQFTERIDDPSTNMVRIWTRFSNGSLFMPRMI